MGDFSYLRFVPDSCANTPIDWTRVPEASRQKILQWAYDWKTDKPRPLPTTVGELAKFVDQSKFFGYFSPDLCTLVMDISEFGLKPATGHSIPVGPRFYMKYLEQIWFLLFDPGKRSCVMGNSEDIIRKDASEEEEDMESEDKGDAANVEDKGDKGDIEDKEDMEDKLDKGDTANKGDEEDEEEDDDDDDYDYDVPIPAEEVALAQEFDTRLREEVSRRMTSFTVKVTKKLAGWDASMLEDNLQFAQFAEAMMTLPTSHPAHKALISSVFSRF